MKLNLGCGVNKIDGFINVDIDPEVKPDEVWSFVSKFPKENDSVDEIVMYHVIEHIERKTQAFVLMEIYRVLKPGGKVTFTYPEFNICVDYWRSNKGGQRDFWEQTIYGRQMSDHDYHVTIMDTELFCRRLAHKGFEVNYRGFEKDQNFNAIVKATKVDNLTYEEGLVDSIGLRKENA